MCFDVARDALFAAACALAIGGASGCLDEADLESIEEEGLYANGATLHPNAGAARVDIPVCWENPSAAPGTSNQARAAWRDDRRKVIDESWGRFARMNFIGWDTLYSSSPER